MDRSSRMGVITHAGRPTPPGLRWIVERSWISNAEDQQAGNGSPAVRHRDGLSVSNTVGCKEFSYGLCVVGELPRQGACSSRLLIRYRQML